MDLDEKTDGNASRIYFEEGELKEIQEYEHFVQTFKSAPYRIETDALEYTLSRTLNLGERILLAIRAASKIDHSKEAIEDFCKKGGKLQEYNIPENDPSILYILKDLDHRTSGAASKAYFSKASPPNL